GRRAGDGRILREPGRPEPAGQDPGTDAERDGGDPDPHAAAVRGPAERSGRDRQRTAEKVTTQGGAPHRPGRPTVDPSRSCGADITWWAADITWWGTDITWWGPTVGRPTRSLAQLPAEQVQRLLELAVQRRAHVHPAPQRVREAQAFGVQQHAVHALHAEDAVMAPVAMAGVADHMVRKMLEVATDLPEAAGLRLAAQQGIARAGEPAHRYGQFTGGQALEIGDGQLLQRLAGAAIKVVVHLPGCFG